MTDQTRANFESHFALNWRQAKRTHDDSMYIDKSVQAKWEGYLAGRAAAPVADERAAFENFYRTDRRIIPGMPGTPHVKNMWTAWQARAELAAAAPVAVPDGKRHRVPCTTFPPTICAQPAFCHANGCKDGRK